MAARSVDQVRSGVHSVSRWRDHAERRPLRHRLAVLAPDVGDVVQHAGGWIFDRASAGWEVTVLVPEPRDVYPLQILGATVLDLQSSLDTTTRSTWPTAVALSASMYSYQSMIRDGVLECLDSCLLEIVLWGEQIPAEIDDRFADSYHKVSVAARAFKARALAAAGLSGAPAEAVEQFRTADSVPPSHRSHVRDLLSAS